MKYYAVISDWWQWKSMWFNNCCCSVAQSCLTLCHLMDCSIPGFPVLHHLPELAQTHVHLEWWCHPTSSSSVIPFSSCLQSFPGFSNESFLMSQLFTSGGQSIEASASVLQWIFRIDFFFRTDWFNLLAVQGLIRTSCGSEVFSCWDTKNKSILWKYKGEAFHLLLFLLLLLPLPFLFLFILLLCKRDIFFKAIKRWCI